MRKEVMMVVDSARRALSHSPLPSFRSLLQVWERRGDDGLTDRERNAWGREWRALEGSPVLARDYHLETKRRSSLSGF